MKCSHARANPNKHGGYCIDCDTFPFRRAEYRIGQPLEAGQSPLRVVAATNGVAIIVHRPDGAEVVNVGVAHDIWPDHIGPAVAALNNRIAGWPVGPFTVDEVRQAA